MTLSAGTRLGPYEIVAPLGSGGMGEVYRARDTRLQREVAVKVLPAETAESPAALARFEREACAVAALSHPNLVVLFDVGREGRTAYAVLELLEGRTLREALAGGALPEETVLDVARQLADGLTAAHGKGIVHRDLKPENIFLTAGGRVKVLDFGLAKPLPAQGETTQAPTQPLLTEQGTALGTPSYMAPEQARGRACDARSDLFAFGAVVYELLTGRRAFRGESAAETLAEILTRTPPEPETHGPVGEALWAIARRCLQKDPEARFQSARDVGFALEATARPAPRVSPTGATRSVAVLPFKELVRDGETSHLGLGLADATVTELAAIRSLLVRPTASILKYEGKSVDPQAAGRELGADVVVDGSLQRAGTRLRVTVQLVETSTGRSLWGGKIDTSLEDVFAVQDEVSRRIAEALEVRLSGDARRSQADGRAAALTMEGRVHLLRESLPEVDAGIRCFQEALGQDPGFAPALAGLADAYVRMAFSYEPEGSWYERAQEATARALASDPASPEARYAKARLLWSPRGAFDVAGSLRELAACLAARPSFNEAWDRLGIMLLHVDLLEEGLAAFDRAKAIDPRDPSAAVHTGLTLYFQGRFAEALELTGAAVARIPSQWAYYQLAQCQLALGLVAQAEESAGWMERHFPAAVLQHSLRGLVAALRGDAAAARRQVALVVENRRAYGHYHHAQHDVARILALLGDKDEAFRWLEDAAANGFPCSRVYEADPLLSSLRGDARFDSLLADLRSACRPHSRLYRELFA